MKLALVSALLVISLAVAAEEPWVSTGKDGHLVYHADACGNHVPDFSNCGYHGGGGALPADCGAEEPLSGAAEGPVGGGSGGEHCEIENPIKSCERHPEVLRRI
jgi:hypothetical protein